MTTTNPTGEATGTGSARRAFTRLTELANDPAAHTAHAHHTADTGRATYSVTYLSGPEGSLQVEWCNHCPLIEVICEHFTCSWNPSGTALTCDLCGEDLT